MRRLIHLLLFVAVCVALVMAQQPSPEPTPESTPEIPVYKVEAFDSPQDLEKQLNAWAKEGLHVEEHFPVDGKEWFIATNDAADVE